MPLFNEMTHNIAKNPQFLLDSLASVDDDFSRRLVRVQERVMREGAKQKAVLGIHRSDYMLHTGEGGGEGEGDLGLLQVELNRISCAFPALSSLVAEMHRYLLANHSVPGYAGWASCPPNSSFDRVAFGLFKAWELFSDPKAVVMMVVQDGERNSADQKHLEYRLWESHRVRLIRCSLADIASRASYAPDGTMTIDGCVVAVAYFRAGYRPQDYPTEAEWRAREELELSRAIKCPNISYHLCGTKKVQQVLAGEGVVERFCSPSAASAIRATFAGLYSLDPDQADQIIPRVLATPSRYVMKPQREGGGNLLHGDKMVAALKDLPPAERSAYIIMERIVPPVVDSIYLVKEESKLVSSVSELGIYGVFLGDSERIFLNEAAGHLLRTKSAAAEDGGVVAGVAVLDSPYLI